MSGRSAKLALLLVLALAPTQAHARAQNFASGSPVAIGIVAGAHQRPSSAFAAGNQTTSSNLSNYFSFEPAIDLVNVQFRLRGGWTFYPLLNGEGTDSFGNFTENSSAGSFDFGARVLLIPWLSKNLERRLYVSVGVANSLVRLRNARKYSSGGMANLTYSETLQGAGVEITSGLGFEFFALQNYSIQLEGGYLHKHVGSFKYRSSTDSSNQPRGGSDVAKDAAGGTKGFHVYSWYAQVALMLNL